MKKLTGLREFTKKFIVFYVIYYCALFDIVIQIIYITLNDHVL